MSPLPPVIPDESRAVIGLPQQLDVRTLVSSVLKTQRGVFSGATVRDVAQGTLRWLAEAGVALYLDGEPFRLWGHSYDSLRRLLDEKKVFTDD